MLKDSLFFTLNRDKILKHNDAIQYFKWIHEKIHKTSIEQSIPHLQLTRNHIITWLEKLTPESLQEVFSFTNTIKVHHMLSQIHDQQELTTFDQKLLEYFSLMSVNYLFDTLTIQPKGFLAYLLSTKLGQSMFHDVNAKLLMHNNSIELDVDQGWASRTNSIPTLILKEFEKSVIIRYYQYIGRGEFTQWVTLLNPIVLKKYYNENYLNIAYLEYTTKISLLQDQVLSQKAERKMEKNNDQRMDQKVETKMFNQDRNIGILTDFKQFIKAREVLAHEQNIKTTIKEQMDKKSDEFYRNQWSFNLSNFHKIVLQIDLFLIGNLVVKQLEHDLLLYEILHNAQTSTPKKKKNKKKNKQTIVMPAIKLQLEQNENEQREEDSEIQAKELVSKIIGTVIEQLDEQMVYEESNEECEQKSVDQQSIEQSEVQLESSKTVSTGNSCSTSELDNNSSKEQVPKFRHEETHLVKKQSQKQNKKEQQQNNKMNTTVKSQSEKTTPQKPKKLSQNIKLNHSDCKPKSLDKDIDQFTYRAAKEITFCRLQYLVNKLLQASIVLYGSCATGLDLEESDIDIGITGYEYYQIQQIQTYLGILQSELRSMTWVAQCRLIWGNIMVLKLDLDPKQVFIENDQNIINNFNLFYLSPTDQSKIISVDITWHTNDWGQQYMNNVTQHYGFESTSILHQWIGTLYGYREIMLILKYLLKKKNLNDSYTGGISSYCLAIMLASIYSRYIQCAMINKRQILLDFLDKFGNNFDPFQEAVDVCPFNPNPFLRLEQSPFHPPLSIYSPVTKTIISTKATKTPEILQEFKQLHKYLTKSNKLSAYFRHI